jgi:hypothetical protein
LKHRSAQTRGFLAAATAVVLMVAGACASAQAVHRCNSGSGAYISDRPCAGAPPTVLKFHGPVADRTSHQTSYTPPLAKAPDILPYLGVECAMMNDAVRTGPTRGLKGAAMSELQQNYRLRCAEDEQQAHQKMSEAKRDDRAQRQQVQAAQNAEQARVRTGIAQCNELLGILAGKRLRTVSMTEGERNDHERSEANYRARCKT